MSGHTPSSGSGDGRTRVGRGRASRRKEQAASSAPGSAAAPQPHGHPPPDAAATPPEGPARAPPAGGCVGRGRASRRKEQAASSAPGSAAAPQPHGHPPPDAAATPPEGPARAPPAGADAAVAQQSARSPLVPGVAVPPRSVIQHPLTTATPPQSAVPTPPGRAYAAVVPQSAPSPLVPGVAVPPRSAIQRRQLVTATPPQSPVHTPPARGAEAHRSLTPQKHHLAASSSSAAEAVPDIASLGLGGAVANIRAGSTDVQPAFPRRPNYCGVPRTVKVTANHFEVTLPKDGSVHHYDVEITKVGIPEPFIPKGRKHEVFSRFVDLHLGNTIPVFDGQKNMYACTQLQPPAQQRRVSMGSAEYCVNVQWVAELRFSDVVAFYRATTAGTRPPQALIQALDILLRYQARQDTLWPAENLKEISGVELFHCLITSLRAGQLKTYVNVDTKLVAFHQETSLLNLIELRTVWSRAYGAPEDIQLDKINAKFKGMTIHVQHLSFRRHYVVKRFTRESAEDLKLSGDGKSVADYFREKYRVLDYPHLPCVEVVSKNLCYLPVEMCFASPTQKCERGLDDNEANDFKSAGNLRPSKMLDLTRVAVKKVVEKTKYMLAFGMQVVTEPVTFEARVLAKPFGITDIPNMDPPRIKTTIRGTIVNTCSDTRLHNNVQKFSERLVHEAGLLNITLKPPSIIKRSLQSLGSIENMLSEAMNLAGAGFPVIFVILDGKNSPHYNSIKLVAETRVGVITQCVAAESVRKEGNIVQKIAKNVMRKVRAKIGCANVSMPEMVNGFNFVDVMVVGADVTHPGPTEKNTPSVAAVVASVDKRASRYVAALRIQKEGEEARARVEIIQDMRGIAESLLREYKDRNGSFPAKILFYRDGVSEGQFDYVCRYEVRSLQDACAVVQPGYKPLITFVSVQKRHHTRIVATKRNEHDNVLPGTVVDTTITHPVDFDFFLCSHRAKQGSTVRLAHYYVLRDDNKLSAETLQTITLGLCHAYVRCQTPVSIPAPVYYAHHATKRALCYVRAAHGGYDAGMPSAKALENTIKVQSSIEKKMYFV